MLDLATERALDAEYGARVSPNAWVMFDNHTFHRLTGTAAQMGQQIIECMKEDKYCCYVAVRAVANGRTIDELSFHGDYKEPRNTDLRVIKWVAQMDALFPNFRVI